MRGEIIAAMAADMNIKKFNNETDLQFVQRVLYSATACWVKAAALDRNIGDENVDTGVSKKHIYEKVSKLLPLPVSAPSTPKIVTPLLILSAIKLASPGTLTSEK